MEKEITNRQLLNVTSVSQYDSQFYNEIPNIGSEEIRIKGNKVYLFFKRSFDIFASLFGIIFLTIIPILPIIALTIKLTSKGPVLFKDKRVGLNGKEITVYKFRSMYMDAENRIHEYLSKEEYNQWLVERKLDNDPRITLVGKFIRKTSLDELAQLFNILNGSISIVGPRPITQTELNENYSDYQRIKLLSVKPGLTGYWQVYGRSNVNYASGERQKEELAYLPKRSALFDLKIILLTIPAVLKRKGAK